MRVVPPSEQRLSKYFMNQPMTVTLRLRHPGWFVSKRLYTVEVSSHRVLNPAVRSYFKASSGTRKERGVRLDVFLMHIIAST